METTNNEEEVVCIIGSNHPAWSRLVNFLYSLFCTRNKSIRRTIFTCWYSHGGGFILHLVLQTFSRPAWIVLASFDYIDPDLLCMCSSCLHSARFVVILLKITHPEEFPPSRSPDVLKGVPGTPSHYFNMPLAIRARIEPNAFVIWGWRFTLTPGSPYTLTLRSFPPPEAGCWRYKNPSISLGNEDASNV